MSNYREGVEIIIATTFRDFNGSDNDLIQHKFLDSLVNQSFQRFKLVVTVFRERKVNDVVRSKKIECTFYTNKIPLKNKFCLTDVLLNGMVEAELNDSSFLLWTTCDVVFPVDFLEKIAKALEPGLMLTSHPHTIAGSNSIKSINTGFDLLGFEKKLFENRNFKEAIKKYRFYDWGIFEHFLIAVGESLGSTNFNLYKEAPLVKYENDRSPGKETQAWLTECWDSNKKIFDNYLMENKISTKYFNLTYCHSRFTMNRFGFFDLKAWWCDYFRYYLFRVKHLMWRILPSSTKNFLKKLI